MVNEKAPPLRLTNPCPHVSPLLEQIVARCLEKAPDSRFGSMDELLASLRGGFHSASAIHLATAGAGKESASLPSVAPRMRRAARRRWSPGRVLPAFCVRPLANNGWLPDGESLGDAPTSAGGLLEAYAQSAPRSSNAASVMPGSKAVFLLAVGGALALAASIAYVALGPSARRAGAETRASASGQPIPTPTVATRHAGGSGASFGGDVGQAAVDRLGGRPRRGPARGRPRDTGDDTRRERSGGATVKEDGVERCSSTPCSIAYEEPPGEHTLAIARQGYRAEVRTAKPDAPLHVRLMAASAPPRTVLPLPPAPAKDETPTGPNGYKTDIPY